MILLDNCKKIYLRYTIQSGNICTYVYIIREIKNHTLLKVFEENTYFVG